MNSCPRCAAPWTGPACASCGYEMAHPGVLGAYAQALRTLAARPWLALPYLLPSLVLLGSQLATLGVEDADKSMSLSEAAVSVVTLFLMMWWYFAVVGSSARRLRAATGARLVALGPVIGASGLAAAVIAAPLALVMASFVWSPGGALGGLVLLAAVVLLVASVIVAGRAVAVPVEAALTGAAPRAALSAGSARGRENGGLGLVFLALLVLTALAVVPALLDRAGLALGDATLIALGAILSWPIGAWTGLAFVHGLGDLGGGETRFTCPRCGAEARAANGRARCSCGLEGPYQAGS